jgi:hypothetical protein
MCFVSFYSAIMTRRFGNITSDLVNQIRKKEKNLKYFGLHWMRGMTYAILLSY